MGKHYIATRKPRRIARIRAKVAEMLKNGVPLQRVTFDSGNMSNIPVVALCERLEKLGYTKLCYLEIRLDDVIRGHAEAKADAIAEIAYHAGASGLSRENVLAMAAEICPPRYGATGGLLASPFFFLHYPCRVPTKWEPLRDLTLRELELLDTRLELGAEIPLSPLLPR